MVLRRLRVFSGNLLGFFSVIFSPNSYRCGNDQPVRGGAIEWENGNAHCCRALLLYGGYRTRDGIPVALSVIFLGGEYFSVG